MTPKFSIVIPVYNQAHFIGDAIKSILNQTCQDFEIVVVNDCSTDNTAAVVEQFGDPRIILINHEQNQGGSAARNTGMRAAKGDYIAQLDSDDIFTPDKLAAHLRFMEAHPEISVSYNARFQLHHSSDKIRDIYSPPQTVTIKNIVQGYPFAPSDMVTRRVVIEAGLLYDKAYTNTSEDFEYYSRIALAGFRFARAAGVLNYRRYHAGRRNQRLEKVIRLNVQTLNNVFSHPNCPPEAAQVRGEAFAFYYSEVIAAALVQGDHDLGKQFIREIQEVEPRALANPARLRKALYNRVVNNDAINHEEMLPVVFGCLPPPLAVSGGELTGYIVKATLTKGTRSALWGDEAAAQRYFTRAKELGAQIDARYISDLTFLLARYEQELGGQAAAEQAARLYPHLERMAGSGVVRKIQGKIAANQAFAKIRAGDYQGALDESARAIRSDPSYLTNRGIVSIALRSLWNRRSRKTKNGSGAAAS